MLRRAIFCVLLFSVFLVAPAQAADFVPDPLSVQREGPAYRYPQAGWIVVHVEGDPYDRGVQQGKLLWREIQDYLKCYAAQQSSRSPAEGWKLMRTLADALFLRRFDPELLEEMKGIADGAAAGGAKFDGRAIDLTDVVALNAWPEMMCLDDALRAQPTGLEGKAFGKAAAGLTPVQRTSRCSAFAATGPATRDGKAVIGHITMFDIYPCNFFNVWLDVKPTKGHRVVIQAAPGSVQSGMDWYINDAGMVLTETTIDQTTFNPAGMSIGSRSRMSMQYGDNIDAVVNILGAAGNGLYTNEWLLADMKTNEIALYELGTRTSRLMRSSKNEWFGGTPGFYWGCNNTKDLAVRMETLAGVNDRPADMTFVPSDRDAAWLQLFNQSRGEIDADFGKLAFSKPPLVSRDSCDAKYTTADMALGMKSFAHWGDPYGQLWEPSHEQREKFPDAQPIVPNDWTVLSVQPPAPAAEKMIVAIDLKPGGSNDHDADSGHDDDKTRPAPAWHGTLLPATDGDIWLASAFAVFHDYVAHEREMFQKHATENAHESGSSKAKDTPAELTTDERDELAAKLFESRWPALSSAAGRQPVALRKVTADVSDDTWFRGASGRGVMLLAELRRRVGSNKFDAAMDKFGREHAGKPVDSAAFVDAMSATDGVNLKDFFAHWLDTADALPTLRLIAAASEQKDNDFIVTGEIVSRAGFAPANIDVTVESDDGETTSTFPFDATSAKFRMTSDKKPTRVIVNKYGQTPVANGFNWSSSAYKHDLEHTLIVYGTKLDAASNRIAAGKLQQAIIDQWQHTVVAIKADTEVKESDLRDRHLVLIGRPECSELISRLTKSLPITFGRGSFVARGQVYANADSAVIATGANPRDARYSIVCVAGLSSGATLRAARNLPTGAPTPLKVMPANGKDKDIVPPAAELVREFK